MALTCARGRQGDKERREKEGRKAQTDSVSRSCSCKKIGTKREGRKEGEGKEKEESNAKMFDGFVAMVVCTAGNKNARFFGVFAASNRSEC